jgi:hypothetical protein
VFSIVNADAAAPVGAAWPGNGSPSLAVLCLPRTIDLTGNSLGKRFGCGALGAPGPLRPVLVAAQGIASPTAAMLVRLSVIMRLPVVHFLVG